MKKLLTINEIGDALGIPQPTMSLVMGKADDFPEAPYTAGKRHLWDVEDVETIREYFASYGYFKRKERKARNENS